jgi:hypothetical protein
MNLKNGKMYSSLLGSRFVICSSLIFSRKSGSFDCFPPHYQKNSIPLLLNEKVFFSFNRFLNLKNPAGIKDLSLEMENWCWNP